MSDPGDVAGWVDRAEEDFELARRSVHPEPVLPYGAAFHAQQCAEKYLKAILVRHNLVPPRTHDLGALITLCESVGVTIPIPVGRLLLLSQYAVQLRYPGEDLSTDEARSAVEIAEKLRAVARQILELG